MGEEPDEGGEISASHIWRAILVTGRKLGLASLLASIIANEVAATDEHVMVLRSGPGKREFTASMHHLCGPDCEGKLESCFTALLLEAMANRKGREVLAVKSLTIRDGTCEVVLGPHDWEEQDGGSSSSGEARLRTH